MKKALLILILLLSIASVSHCADKEYDEDGDLIAWMPTYYNSASLRSESNTVYTASEAINCFHEFELVGFNGIHYSTANASTFTDVSYAHLDDGASFHFGDTISFDLDYSGLTNIKGFVPSAIYIYLTDDVPRGEHLAGTYAKWILPYEDSTMTGHYELLVDSSFINGGSNAFNKNTVNNILNGTLSFDTISLDSIKIYFLGTTDGSGIGAFNLAEGVATKDAYIKMTNFNVECPHTPEPFSCVYGFIGIAGIIGLKMKLKKSA